MKLADILLVFVVFNLVLAVIDIALGLTMNSSVRWVMFLIVPLPLYVAGYCFRVWWRCR